MMTGLSECAPMYIHVAENDRSQAHMTVHDMRPRSTAFKPTSPTPLLQTHRIPIETPSLQ